MTEFGAATASSWKMQHKTTQTVFSYFNRIRGERSAPLRSEIEPSALKSVLPDIFILETGRSTGAQFRLAGTRVCTILGRELRGENFAELWHTPNRHKIRLAVEAVIANQAPLTIGVRSLADEEVDGSLEMLLMPLFSRPGICDRVMGTLADLGTPPLLGERNRILMAGAFRFLAADDEPAELVQAASLGAMTSNVSVLRTRLTQLRVLQGGRKD